MLLLRPVMVVQYEEEVVFDYEACRKFDVGEGKPERAQSSVLAAVDLCMLCDLLCF